MQMRWWVPLLLLLALGAACAESIEEKTQRCFAVSYTQEAAKNYAGAITALADAPDSYVVELRLGWLHYLKGNYTSAETHYKAAVKKNADALEAKVGYLLPLLALGNWKEAEKIARQVLDVDPGNYYATLRLAYALRWDKKYDDALELLARPRKRYPTDVSLLLEEALSRSAKGDRETAVLLYNQVLLLDPDNTLAKPFADEAGHAQRECFNASYKCEANKDYAGALTAIAAQPAEYLPELRRGWLCYLKGDYPTAVTHYRAAIAAAPESLEARVYGLLPMLAAEDYTEAVTMAESALELDKEHYLVNLRLAYALRLQKQTAKAVTIVNRLLPRFPTDVSLLTEQGLDAALAGDKTDTARIFHIVLMLDPTNATAKAQLGIK